MGTNLNPEVLLNLRSEILDSVLKSIRAWDETMESGIYIIESTAVNLDSVESINKKISQLDNGLKYDEEYKNKLEEIIREQGNLIEFIRIGQKGLLEGIKQVKKSNQVLNNYIKTNRQPIFIDKDL